MQQRIVIVGGVAGGASAAAKARRMNDDVEIVMFEKGPYISYGNCGIPYYIGGDIPQREDLFLVTPETFWDRFRIDVRLHHEVLRIDRAQQEVFIQGPDGPFSMSYDRLILATGGVPLRPAIPGISLPGVHSLWTIPDGDAIMEMVQTLPAQAPVVIIGGGFIGLEMAEGLQQRGFSVTVVEKMAQVMPPLDPEIAAFAVQELQHHGVQVLLGDGVASFVETGGTVSGVRLESGRELPAALAIVSIGVRPETSLATAAGLEIGTTDGLSVDPQMRTSDPAIYAAGDMVESVHRCTETKMRIPLAGPANKQGRTAGHNAAVDLLHPPGDHQAFQGVLGTSIVRVFDLALAQTGLSQKTAELLGMDVQVSHTFSADHAGYYPGARTILLKLITERASGRLLGAQAVGASGADKRIDVLATAISAGLTVFDLEQLDLAYAPPFSAAKDPVNIAGMVAANVRRGQYRLLSKDGLQKHPADYSLLDVRSQEEWDAGHIPGAVHIPIDELRNRLADVPKGRPIVIYCAVGQRAYTAYRMLTQQGFSDLYSLSGGWQLWEGILDDPEYEVETH